MAETAEPFDTLSMPGLEDMQHWTWVMGRAQQLMMEHVAQQLTKAPARAIRSRGRPISSITTPARW
jgi:polyhydroxyalkanoate synthase